MADSKITALTALTAADPANDMIPIVDVSDTPPASGNTKRISINNLLACSPSATLASATITGALTVDTTTLVVDPTNDRVGIGTATPAAKLIVRDGSNRNLLVSSDATQLGSAGIAIGSFTDNAAGYAPLSIIAGTSMAFGMNGTTAMTLNSTGLGVGGSPNTGLLTVGATTNASATANALTILSQRATFVVTANGATDAAGTTINYAWANGGQGPLIFRNAAISNVLTLDSSGNVGIGVTPSAWTPSDRALQFAYGNSIATATSTNFSIVRNAQELAGGWTYSANGFVQLYNLESDGGYKWYTAASGTASNPVSFGSAKMTLDASGRLLIGTTDAGSNSGIGLKAAYSATAPYFSTVGSSTSASEYSYLLYSTGGTPAFKFYVSYSGQISATSGTVAALSDARFKENIQDIDVGLGAILALKPRKFDWKAGKGKDIKGDRGFIAQEFETVFPNLIDEWADPAPEGEAPYKSVRQDLIPVLVKAIQELTARVQTLEAK